MSQRIYRQLPINADEGFPQAFRLNFNGNVYQIWLYVNVLEEGVETADDYLYNLPVHEKFPNSISETSRDAFMVMRVAQEGAGGPAVIFQRKLVPNLEYEAAELVFVFRKMVVARRNLNGVGAFGSQVIGGVATRWAS